MAGRVWESASPSQARTPCGLGGLSRTTGPRPLGEMWRGPPWENLCAPAIGIEPLGQAPPGSLKPGQDPQGTSMPRAPGSWIHHPSCTLCAPALSWLCSSGGWSQEQDFRGPCDPWSIGTSPNTIRISSELPRGALQNARENTLWDLWMKGPRPHVDTWTGWSTAGSTQGPRPKDPLPPLGEDLLRPARKHPCSTLAEVAATLGCGMLAERSQELWSAVGARPSPTSAQSPWFQRVLTLGPPGLRLLWTCG